METNKIPYQGYPNFIAINPSKKYALYLSTGTGVAEDQPVNIGYILESDDYFKIMGWKEKLNLAFNGFYSEHKSWAGVKFHVHKYDGYSYKDI